MTAKVKILVEGYYFQDKGGQERVCPTVSLVRDKDFVIVVDPGVLKNPKIIIDALAKEGLSPADINIVCLTHSHIDHYRNLGMFPEAKILDYFGLWHEDTVEDWEEKFSENIQILKTPGHDRTSISLFVKTDDDIVAICGDVFWKEDYPEVDIYASNLKELENSRKLVLKMSHWIIPGHGPMYKTKNGQKLQEIKNGKKPEPAVKITGRCRYCKKPFLKEKDKCVCQEWLCYNCCECESDCSVCRCSYIR